MLFTVTDYLHFFSDFGLMHGQAHTLEQEEDGKAPPQGVQHIECKDPRDEKLMQDFFPNSRS